MQMYIDTCTSCNLYVVDILVYIVIIDVIVVFMFDVVEQKLIIVSYNSYSYLCII